MEQLEKAGAPSAIPSELPDVVPISDTANVNKLGSQPADSLFTPKDDTQSQPGILSRTLGSISSLGSFSTSPNFSQLVDFSSGLFSRSQDERGRVQDIHDVKTNSPPSTPKKPSNVDLEEVKANLKEMTDSSRSSQEKFQTNGENVHHDISVESVVKLDDKPELFQSLDELIPRPARQYDDPPLYLCLKVGHPINKAVSKTCPVESYMKKKPKPEYWFSIPRERVDHLYAFFIQWSPNIYGGEDEIDPKERGFVVIEDDEDNEESINVVEDHFPSEKQRLIKQLSMSKDWEKASVRKGLQRFLSDPGTEGTDSSLSDPANYRAGCRESLPRRFSLIGLGITGQGAEVSVVKPNVTVEQLALSPAERLLKDIDFLKEKDYTARADQLVNYEEARRRLSLLEDEALPLPELSSPSTILEEDMIRKLVKNLPPRCEGYPWTLIYSSDKNGFSLKTMYRSMGRLDSPILLVIKDTRDQRLVPCYHVP
jgi:hypothetical protein